MHLENHRAGVKGAVLSVANRACGFCARRGAEWLFRRPVPVRMARPLISFTFDDFPRSALLTAGNILSKYGFRGTYYAAFGLMGTQTASGPMFLAEDVAALLDTGHEIGSHTFAHCHSMETPPRVFERSLIENQLALQNAFPGESFRTFAYPVSAPRMHTKRLTSAHFLCSRGGGEKPNIEYCDLNYLSAYFLERSGYRLDDVQRIIDLNAQNRGWLIFATHDVGSNPSPFGCTAAFFEKVVQASVGSDALILPVASAVAHVMNGSRFAKPAEANSCRQENGDIVR